MWVWLAAGFGLCVVLCCVGVLILTINHKRPSEDTTRGRGDMSLKEYILQKPSKPTAVQVDCELDTYYNFAFSECAETHYSFRVKSDSPYTTAHVYAPKSSEHGRRLYELLKNGGKQQVTLRLQRVGPYGEDLPAKDDSCFALVGIVDGKK